MKISRISAFETFDSRGIPTITCQIHLDDKHIVSSQVPSGASTGSQEAFELRDNDDRILGKGVFKAIHNIEHVIAPHLIGKDVNALAMDSILMDLDTTPRKTSLGGNTTLAVSIALFRAQAYMEGIELFELLQSLSGTEQSRFPIPLFNVMNGGAHANNNITIQEFMVIPQHSDSFRDMMEAGVTFYQHLKIVLDRKGYSTAIGDEGGFAPNLTSDHDVFDLFSQVANTIPQYTYTFGIDAASTEFYDQTTRTYSWQQQSLTALQLTDIYTDFIQKYPLALIEDGCAEFDVEGWQYMTEHIGENTTLVGDDIFVTNPMKIRKGVLKNIGNAVLIKPNQIGTVSQTLAAIDACKNNNRTVVISHRSGETNDTFISDLAVGTASQYIKAGAPCRGERLAKYNRLLEIEYTTNHNTLNGRTIQ